MFSRAADVALTVSPIIATIDASARQFNHATLLTGEVNWSNWAIVLVVGVLAFFTKRLVDKLDTVETTVNKLDRRLIALETKHSELHGSHPGGRRPYDPIARVYDIDE